MKKSKWQDESDDEIKEIKVKKQKKSKKEVAHSDEQAYIGPSMPSVDEIGPSLPEMEYAEYPSVEEYDENHITSIDEMSTEEVPVQQKIDDHDENHDEHSHNIERSLPKTRSYPVIMSCASVDKYEKLNRIDEGTYGIVYRAKDKSTNNIVALKKLKLNKEENGFPITSLREIYTLLLSKHENIINVQEIVLGNSLDSIFMVMDFVEHDLKGLLEMMKTPFLQSEVKTLLMQLLDAVNHLHENWIIHRDLKTSNILMNNMGTLKVADFGLARMYGSPIEPMTPLVVTLWYRAPELLLGAKTYGTAIDVWSIGCIFGELALHKPLIAGSGELDQLNKIFKLLGTPKESIWPGFLSLPHAQTFNFVNQPYSYLGSEFKDKLSEGGIDLLKSLLTYDPERRISCDVALNHHYFSESPLPKHPSMFPTWPSKGEGVKKRSSPSAPVGHIDADDDEKEDQRRVKQ